MIAVLPSDKAVVTLGVTAKAPGDHPYCRKDFAPGIRRLKRSLAKHKFVGGAIYWDRGYPVGCPTHLESPFAFKPFCFYAAWRLGYRYVLWLDASVKVRSSVDPIFRKIVSDGYIMFQETHSVGEYCTDTALKSLGITRERAFEMPSCWGCAIGLDLGDPTAQEFLQSWRTYAVDGVTFPGPKWSGVRGWPQTISSDSRVKGHRHDQTAASVIAQKLGMTSWWSKRRFYDYFDNDRRSIPRYGMRGRLNSLLAALFNIRRVHHCPSDGVHVLLG
jgi:hypothetical protein